MAELQFYDVNMVIDNNLTMTEPTAPIKLREAVEILNNYLIRYLHTNINTSYNMNNHQRFLNDLKY